MATTPKEPGEPPLDLPAFVQGALAAISRVLNYREVWLREAALDQQGNDMT